MSGPILLAFGIWMLLTSEFSWLNAMIGLAGALVVSMLQPYRFSAGQFLKLAVLTLVYLPQAVGETFLMVFRPHTVERYQTHELKDPDNPWAAFMEVFIITFTPLTLVTSNERNGKIRLHVISRKEHK